jgi:hypothetical protein
MTTLTEGKHAGEFMVSEGNKTRSREVVTIASGNTVVPGEVLGIVTASGKYAVYDQDASDGTEAAAGISWDHVDASAADVTDAVVVIRDAEVNGNELTWPGDIDAGEQTAAEAELAALGVIVRY